MDILRSIYVGEEEIYFNDRGIANNPFKDLHTGLIVQYKSNNYFFRPNGSVSYLFTKLKDFKMHRHKKCVARKKLMNCNFYICDNIDLTSLDDTESSDHETIEDIMRTRPNLFTHEEMYRFSRQNFPSS